MPTFLQLSGAISLNDINGVFLLGASLDVHRGTTWYMEDESTGTFPSEPSDLTMQYFYGKGPESPSGGGPIYGVNPNPVVRGNYSAGFNQTRVCPEYNRMKVHLHGRAGAQATRIPECGGGLIIGGWGGYANKEWLYGEPGAPVPGELMYMGGSPFNNEQFFVPLWILDPTANISGALRGDAASTGTHTGGVCDLPVPTDHSAPGGFGSRLYDFQAQGGSTGSSYPYNTYAIADFGTGPAYQTAAGSVTIEWK